jgi:hypothetical protein
MWVFTQHGFVSFVQDRKDPEFVWVRARIKEDIANTFPDNVKDIITMPGADYLYRLRIPKLVASMAMWNAVADIDYDSHAKEVMDRRSHKVTGRMSAYYKVWNALADLQPFAPFAKTPRPVGNLKPHAPAKPATQYGKPVTGDHYGRDYDWDAVPLPSMSTGYRNGMPWPPADLAEIETNADAAELVEAEKAFEAFSADADKEAQWETRLDEIAAEKVEEQIAKQLRRKGRKRSSNLAFTPRRPE